MNRSLSHRTSTAPAVVPPLPARDRDTTQGAVLWLTGLSGSGKTTLAQGLRRACVARGRQAVVLDGDEFRRGVSADLGFSPRDREENVRRAAEVAALLAQSGLLVAAAFISPTRASRALARRIIERTGARAGRLTGFTGVGAPFEPPIPPDLRIDTGTMAFDEALDRLLATVRPLLD